MDRPPVNAQNSEFRQELIATFDSLTDRDDVRVAILTGTGKMFSAGADMKERPDPEHPGEYWKFNRLRARMLQRDPRMRQAGDRRGERPGAGRRPRAGRGVRHHPVFRQRAARHAGDRCRPRRRRGDAADAVRPLARAAHVLHRLARAGGRAVSHRRGGMLRAAGTTDAGGDEDRRRRSPRKARSACATPSSR